MLPAASVLKLLCVASHHVVSYALLDSFPPLSKESLVTLLFSASCCIGRVLAADSVLLAFPQSSAAASPLQVPADVLTWICCMWLECGCFKEGEAGLLQAVAQLHLLCFMMLPMSTHP